MQTSLAALSPETFRTEVLGATLGGNTDIPEASLDALMQAMVNNND